MSRARSGPGMDKKEVSGRVNYGTKRTVITRSLACCPADGLGNGQKWRTAPRDRDGSGVCLASPKEYKKNPE